MHPHRLQGHITVFLSLTLLVLISLVSTALQSAAYAGSRYFFSAASEAAAQSMFAAYDTRAWEAYRVLMLRDTTQAQVIAAECMESYNQSRTLCPITVSQVELTNQQTLADQGAAGWQDAVIQYMEKRLPVELATDLAEQVGIIEKLSGTIDCVKALQGIFGPVAELEERLCHLEEKLQSALEVYQEGKALFYELENSLARFQQLKQRQNPEQEPSEPAPASPSEPSPVPTLPSVAPEEVWLQLSQDFEAAKQYAYSMYDRLTEVVELAYSEADTVRQVMTQVQDLIHSLGDLAADSGLSVVSHLGDYISSLTNRLDVLQKLPSQLSDLVERVRQLRHVSLPSWEAVMQGDGQERLEQIQQLTTGIAGIIWNGHTLGMGSAGAEEETSLQKIWDLKRWLEQGILGLAGINMDQVSTEVLQRRLQRTESEPTEPWKQAYHNFLYGEYALTHTADYTQRGTDSEGLRYETEYLIGGHNWDSANLTDVVTRLFLIRGAFNFVHLLQDPAKKAQADTAAAAVSAALGGWVPIPLIASILLVFWALAEGVCDVRSLMDGGQVPLLKTSGSWQLDWDDIWKLMSGDYERKTVAETGIEYEGYLRFLLFLVPLSEKCYRTMEIAEENLGVYYFDFRIDEAVCRGEVTVKGQCAGQACSVVVPYGYTD